MSAKGYLIRSNTTVSKIALFWVKVVRDLMHMMHLRSLGHCEIRLRCQCPILRVCVQSD